LHSYIRSMPAQVVVLYFFYFLIFSLFLEVAPMSVSTIHILSARRPLIRLWLPMHLNK